MQLTEAELKKQLKEGQFARVYFLYGQESYLTAHYAAQIAAKAVGETALAEFNLQKFDGQSCTIDEIEDAAEALPVMAERKCVVVRDLDFASAGAAGQERLLSLLRDPPEGCVLVFWLDAVEADVKKNAKWKSFLSAADKAGAAVHFPRRTAGEITKLLCSGASRRGCSLSQDNARRMQERCGSDLNLLLGELDKLSAYAEGREITREDIEALGVQNLEASVFDLSKALLQGSYAKAYAILDRLFAMREEPVAILAVLSGAYADLYRATVARAAGQQAESLSSVFAYRGKEFRLRNAARDSAAIPLPVLRESLEVLAGADRQLKSSRTDKRVVLEQTAAKLILLGRTHGR
ncbi:MAG TPA: DNA polymerase III subunit delta [Firmicutes bacterium]|nr:DNA polymerase III subunit delta [Bacillota bacterium]